MKSNKLKKTPTGDYPVGFCRPPTATQFPEKKSGNPKGRPKGQPSILDVYVSEAARVVKYKIGDKEVTATMRQAIFRKLMQLGVNGNVAAIRLALNFEMLLLGQAQKADAADPDQVSGMVSGELPDEDALRRMVARFQHLSGNDPKDESA